MITLILIIATIIYVIQKMIKYIKSKSKYPKKHVNIKATSVGTQTDADVMKDCSDPIYVDMNEFEAREAMYMTVTKADTHYDSLNWTNAGKSGIFLKYSRGLT
jgi:hypothetical protein